MRKDISFLSVDDFRLRKRTRQILEKKKMKKLVTICATVLVVLACSAGAHAKVTLFGHWNLDEGIGNTISDSSPMANHGTISDSSMWTTPGHDGTGFCLSFGGYSNPVEASVPHDPSLNFNGSISLSAWVKPIPTGQSILPVIVKGGSSGTPYALFVYDNEVAFLGNYQTGGTSFLVKSGDTLPFNEWTHIEATYDMQYVRLYINGNLKKEEPISFTINNNNEPLYFGVDYPGFTERYKGLIDEVVISVAEPAVPDIDVCPLSHDFGDVELGTSSTVIVTISNVDNGGLNVSGIGLETDFAITSAPAAAIVVEPGQTVDVEITYTPTVLGDNSAVLKISSDDPDEPVVEVQLSAAGVEIPPPPSEQIANILSFFDASVNDGSLVGDGQGNSAEKRLNALRNMIEAAGDLIEDELLEEACQQLLDVYGRMDGQPKPPDFVTGGAVAELASMVQDLMTSLGCE